MLKKELKKIYAFEGTESRFFIDVQLEDYRDAYSEWDFSPFINRDLDEDLIDFLLECSYEIPRKYPVTIRLHILHQTYDALREGRSLQGMKNFFVYQMRKIRNKKLRVYKDILTYLIIGIVLLLAGFYSHRILEENMAITVLSEGLFIGGWVMMWEMFSAWFFDVKKLNRMKRHFQRLHDCDIEFSYGKKM